MSVLVRDVGRQRFEEESGRPLRQLVVLPVTEITATSAGASQALLTVPAGQFFEVGNMVLTNQTALAVMFSMWAVPDGGSAGDANSVYHGVPVGANATTTIDQGVRPAFMFQPGTTLRVAASTASDLNVTLWGHLVGGGTVG